MANREDIEAYLMRCNLPYQEVADNMWVVHDISTTENVVISLTEDIILFRLKLLELSAVKDREAFYSKLLELNAGEMLHGAYGIAEGSVLLTSALRVENLDYNEFQGTIDDFSLALTNHYDQLAGFRAAN